MVPSTSIVGESADACLVDDTHSFLIDPCLSIKAKGVLALILAAPQKATSAESLSSCSSDGLSGTRAALREAVRAGYLTRVRMRNADGTLGVSGYAITGSGQAARPVSRGTSPLGWAYAIADPSMHHVKIGCSSDPRARLRGLQTGWPGLLEILWVAPGGGALEAHLHEHFRDRRVRGEWFDFAGADAVALIAAAAGTYTGPGGRL